MYFNIIQKGIYMKGTITRRLGFVRLKDILTNNNDVLIYTEPLQVSYKEHYGFSNDDNELPF